MTPVREQQECTALVRLQPQAEMIDYVGMHVVNMTAGNVTTNCTDFDIRLVDGPDEGSGRVEVCLGGLWGTVCDDGWDSNDATTVCRQLGYNYAISAQERAIPTRRAYFGEGRGPIHLSRVECFVTDTRLSDCNITVICVCFIGVTIARKRKNDTELGGKKQLHVIAIQYHI